MTQIEQALNERILVLDGATGTTFQSWNLTAEDFGGSELEGCNENLVFTRPDLVEKFHVTRMARPRPQPQTRRVTKYARMVVQVIVVVAAKP
jgi:hypothetical protein